MSKILFIASIILLNSINLFSQDEKWEPAYLLGKAIDGRVLKINDYIIFSVDSATNMDQRDAIVQKTELYLAENLSRLNESTLNDSIYLIVVRDKAGIENLGQHWVSLAKGEQGLPINLLICVYSDKQDAIQRGLMHIMLKMRWGRDKDRLKWLYEGLVYSIDLDTYSCTNHTLEEEYTYMLQNDKLLNAEQLLQLSSTNTDEYKIVCLQSAYIVKRLLEKYGIEKVKKLLTEGMSKFEKIFGSKFEDIIFAINHDIIDIYQEPIKIKECKLYKDCFVESIFADWHPLFFGSPALLMNSKVIGNVRYVVSPLMSSDTRNEAIVKTPKYINENLALLGESEFDEFVNVVLANDKYEIKKMIGFEVGGFAFYNNPAMIEEWYFKEHSVFSVYSENFKTLKHELMHIVVNSKWGIPTEKMEWLIEGIATFGDSSISNDDKYTFEEKYTYLLQNGKLLGTDELITFPSSSKYPEIKIAYNQSAYIVEYLFRKYGIEKLKMLWQNGISRFDEIYDSDFEVIITEINTELNIKYPNLINIDKNLFN